VRNSLAGSGTAVVAEPRLYSAEPALVAIALDGDDGEEGSREDGLKDVGIALQHRAGILTDSLLSYQRISCTFAQALFEARLGAAGGGGGGGGW